MVVVWDTSLSCVLLDCLFCVPFAPHGTSTSYCTIDDLALLLGYITT